MKEENVLKQFHRVTGFDFLISVDAGSGQSSTGTSAEEEICDEEEEYKTPPNESGKCGTAIRR